MGKTYRRDSDRKFKDYSKYNKSKPKKLKREKDAPKFQNYNKSYTDDVDNEFNI